MICFTDYKFKYYTYKDLAEACSSMDSALPREVNLEFIFMSDSNLYMFLGYLLSNGVNREDIHDIFPMLDELRCKDIEGTPQGCYATIRFTPENFNAISSTIKKFSRRFNMATGNY